MTEEEASILNDIDIRFKDVEQAFTTVNECLVVVSQKLSELQTAHNEIVEACSKLQTVDKVLYQPVGDYDYLTMKQNLDLIYERLGKLEGNQ